MASLSRTEGAVLKRRTAKTEGLLCHPDRFAIHRLQSRDCLKLFDSKLLALNSLLTRRFQSSYCYWSNLTDQLLKVVITKNSVTFMALRFNIRREWAINGFSMYEKRLIPSLFRASVHFRNIFSRQCLK